MKYTYWLHEKIQQEITEGYAWYEDKQKGLGLEFLTAIENKIAEIVSHPETFGSKGNPNYREAMVSRFPYIIVYRIYNRKREIFISSIRHVKRAPKSKYRKP